LGQHTVLDAVSLHDAATARVQLDRRRTLVVDGAPEPFLDVRVVQDASASVAVASAKLGELRLELASALLAFHDLPDALVEPAELSLELGVPALFLLGESAVLFGCAPGDCGHFIPDLAAPIAQPRDNFRH